mmetsp:Transcript_6598/g.9678  ORF Transcript_6598/g.9678 Transcript_6598/m.9678 type:complete len:323 (+) Transcript_6598:133-1101(+)
MASSSNTPSISPPGNPVLTAYEKFVSETPLVTRYILSAVSISYLLSWWFDLSYALGTIPYFCITRFELYRVVTAPFICQNILSLVFSYLSFIDMGKRLELSLGSTNFLCYLMTMGICTNVLFLFLCATIYSATFNMKYLMYNSVGIWTLIFAVIATDCSNSSMPTRRLFFFNVPTKWFPLALWGLFTLIGGSGASDLLAIGIGYAYGHGHLNRLKVSAAKCKQWEDSILINFIRRPGWVTGHAAMGESAWASEANSFFSSPQPQTLPTTTTTSDTTTHSAETPAFTGGGRALGSSRQRPTEARAAMLEAAEKRAAISEDPAV